jgi:glycosyltransferase involved in cell wall biosynthesis
MKISYLITTHNEAVELERLLKQLYEAIANTDDEVVILDDYSDNKETIKLLSFHPLFSTSSALGSVIRHRLNGDFGAHKTYGSRHCVGDYIVQLDADEYLSPGLLSYMHTLVEENADVELFRVPRVNIVRGLTEQDAIRWGWKIYSLPEYPNLPIVNWEFDYQARIYKNIERIYWHKALHETITGATTSAHLPLDVDYAIIHDKTIDRQRAQNEFYNKNWSVEANSGRG